MPFAKVLAEPTNQFLPNRMNAQLTLPAVLELVKEREEILRWLKPAQAREMEIRRQLAPYFFPNPVEGTQHIEKDGFEVALKHTITRKVDEAALDSVMPQLPEEFRNIGVLIKYKPSLVMDGYRALNEDERRVFDQALTIDAGAPALEIRPVQPATPAVVATVAGGVMHHVPDVKAQRTDEQIKQDRAYLAAAKADARVAKRKNATAAKKGKKAK